LIGDAPAELGVPSSEEPPPVPQVRDGRIVAGPVSLPVPQGWQVAPAGSGPCDYPARTVRIVLSEQQRTPTEGGPSCRPADLEVETFWNTNVPGWYVAWAPGHGRATVFVAGGDGLTLTPKMIILPGGEPAWLETAGEGVGVMRSGTRLFLPWSKVVITVRGADDVQRQIIDSITGAARRPAGLVLPEQAAYIALTRPRPANSAPDDKVDFFANDVGGVLDLLRTATAADKRGCAREGDVTAQLTIATEFAPYGAGDEETESWERQLTTVVISLGDGCFEAVSSHGGRVRLTAAAVAELAALFKVDLR
jgi:hypothetical protein